jgi:hypothetical protein
MSQHDMSIANQGFPATRSDLNAALVALASTSKGPARPATPYAGQIWLDDDTPSATLWTIKVYDGTADAIVGYHDTAGDRFYPALHKNAIHGLKTSNNGADALNDIDIAVGSARDSTDADDMHLLAALTKRLDAAWAVGTGNGGLDTGAEAASTLYAGWLIKRPDTGVTEVLFSTSFTAPTMPTNYTLKRLIGAFFNDAASAIVAFTQVGDYFRYTGDVIVDVGDATITANTYEVGTLSVPPWALAHIYARLANTTETATSGRVNVRTVGAADDGTTFLETWVGYDQSADAFRVVGAQGTVLANASRQIEYTSSEVAGTATVDIRTLGFTMLTRSEP